jgi:hypothetical protein
MSQHRPCWRLARNSGQFSHAPADDPIPQSLLFPASIFSLFLIFKLLPIPLLGLHALSSPVFRCPIEVLPARIRTARFPLALRKNPKATPWALPDSVEQPQLAKIEERLSNERGPQKGHPWKSAKAHPLSAILESEPIELRRVKETRKPILDGPYQFINFGYLTR